MPPAVMQYCGAAVACWTQHTKRVALCIASLQTAVCCMSAYGSANHRPLTPSGCSVYVCVCGMLNMSQELSNMKDVNWCCQLMTFETALNRLWWRLLLLACIVKLLPCSWHHSKVSTCLPVCSCVYAMRILHYTELDGMQTVQVAFAAFRDLSSEPPSASLVEYFQTSTVTSYLHLHGDEEDDGASFQHDGPAVWQSKVQGACHAAATAVHRALHTPQVIASVQT